MSEQQDALSNKFEKIFEYKEQEKTRGMVTYNHFLANPPEVNFPDCKSGNESKCPAPNSDKVAKEERPHE